MLNSAAPPFRKEKTMADKKGKLVNIIIPVLFILVGMSTAIITVVLPAINQLGNNEIIERYNNNVDNMTPEEKESAVEGMKEYNKTGRSNYYTALGTEEVISYIDIPKIDVYLPVFKGTSDAVLDKGIGVLENYSLPIGGQGTHCVLTGHSGLTTQTMFNNISDLTVGDMFYLHTYGNVLAYEVYKTETVLPDKLALYIGTDIREDYCTLVTCTPKGVNTHRLLVKAKRAPLKLDIGLDGGVSESVQTNKKSAAVVAPETQEPENKSNTSKTIETPRNSGKVHFDFIMIICAVVSSLLIIIGTVSLVLFLRQKKAER